MDAVKAAEIAAEFKRENNYIIKGFAVCGNCCMSMKVAKSYLPEGEKVCSYLLAKNVGKQNALVAVDGYCDKWKEERDGVCS